MYKWKVEKKEKGERLDKFLFKKLPSYSRSFWQKLIRQNKVKVNNKEVLPHYSLKEGDEIIILELPQRFNLKPDRSLKLDIVFENNDFAVINKPAGILVHPYPFYNKPTLVNALLASFPFIKNIGEDNLRPGIVHRLDKDVSGLLLIAKTQKAFEYFKEQFQKRKIKKEYLALVRGEIKKSSGKIELPIGPTAKKGLKKGVKVIKPEKAKKAITFFEVVKKYHHFTLLKVKPLTGRSHQIRVHLKSIGYPIAGDLVYKPKKAKYTKNPPRIFLHAYKLGFYNLEGKYQEFTSPLPPDLNNFLKTLQLK